MSDLPNWLSGLGALFVLIAVVAAAVAVIWSTTAKQRTQILESTNDALTDRVAFLESEALRIAAEHAAEKAKAASEMAAMTEKVKVLERVVTGREQLEAIEAMIVANHREIVDLLAASGSSR